MRYPILIKEDPRTSSFGVVVPDLPGCIAASDTLDGAIAEARAAAAAWIMGARQRNMRIPAASSPTEVLTLGDYKDWDIGFIELPQGEG
jgi:predicted RNase H-like HicB family nuclease